MGIDSLTPALRDRVLARLGLPAPPPAGLEGLRAVYAAWCAGVPFDNVRKMIALRSGPARPLPGRDASDFFTGWLEYGAGGTCWATSHALCELLLSLGFAARPVAASMRDAGVLNHGTVAVAFDGQHWLVDSSLLTGIPLPLGTEVFVSPDAVLAAEVEPENGTHVIWADVPPNEGYLACRLLVDPADRATCLERYEASRERSPFNQRLYARRNRPGALVVLFGNRRLEKTAAGVETRDLSRARMRASLIEEIGLAPGLVDDWIAAGGLDASFEPPSGPPPPPLNRRPPSQR